MKRATYCLMPALLALLAGCSSTPRYDQHFGDAVRQARDAMTINRGAPSDDAAAGIDGRAAHEAATRYQDSFKAPPPVVNTISAAGASR